jgi:uncharacterized alpha-E superfamily protein
MISRVADHCFWFGRYIERAEATSRMLAASVSLALDAELPPSQVWGPVVVVSGEESRFRARIASADDDHPAWGDGELVQRFLVWDEDAGVSLVRSIRGMRWNARSIREVLSHEAWEAINELHLWMEGDVAPASYAQHRDMFYQHVRRSTQLSLGLLRSTMLHDEPLDFVWLGVLLERVNQTARMLDVHHHAFTQMSQRHEVVETALWLSLLRGLSGSEAYLKRAAGRISSEGVPASWSPSPRSRARSPTACTPPTAACATSARPRPTICPAASRSSASACSTPGSPRAAPSPSPAPPSTISSPTSSTRSTRSARPSAASSSAPPRDRHAVAA